MINQYIKDGKRILAEGANGAFLDIDHGSYPFVTSSNTTVGAVCTGLGVPPKRIETIVAAVKAYTTRSGQGPMPTELLDKLGDKIQEKGSEWGVTTGRRRRVGWLDLNILKRGVMINGYSSLMVTKLDILSGLGDLKMMLENGEYKEFKGWDEDITSVRKFEELPKAAQEYILFIEEYCETPVAWIGVGPARDEIIKRF